MNLLKHDFFRFSKWIKNIFKRKMSKLKPLSWEEFYDMHYEAWQNGWTYGPAYPELYDDYLVNWIYFVDYLDYMIASRCRSHDRFRVSEKFKEFENKFQSKDKIKFINEVKSDHWNHKFSSLSDVQNYTLKIFIGEAPPYWAGKTLLKFQERNYFYLPCGKWSGSYFDTPAQLFDIEKEKCWKKIDFLEKLALKGFILIDIFPFPIIQETKIRQEVSSNFGEWIIKSFKNEFDKYINYISASLNNCKNDFIEPKKEFAIAMPLYGALQICFGETSRSNIESFIPEFFEKPISELNDNITEEKWQIVDEILIQNNVKISNKSPRFKFLQKINPSIYPPTMEKLNERLKFCNVGIPLLTTGKISLSHYKYINSKEQN
jgi:hypothetical protein